MRVNVAGPLGKEPKLCQTSSLVAASSVHSQSPFLSQDQNDANEIDGTAG